MKFSLKYIFFFFFIISCVQNNITVEKTDITKKTFYTSTGFALIYNNNLYKKKLIGKKLSNREYQILHLTLKPNTYVKITNPENQKSIIAKVKYKTFHPIIYNSVISKVIADNLKIDEDNSYVEIVEVKKDNYFIAKKSKTFDEEKNVANKAPVTDINILNISLDVEKNNVKKVVKKKKFLIIIGDFYFKETALNMKNKLLNENEIKSVYMKKISYNKFRVASGPYKTFTNMKNDFFILKNLGFEHLDIIKID